MALFVVRDRRDITGWAFLDPLASDFLIFCRVLVEEPFLLRKLLIKVLATLGAFLLLVGATVPCSVTDLIVVSCTS